MVFNFIFISNNSHLYLETNSITTPPEPVKTYLFLMLITNSQKGVYGSLLHQHITLPVETLLTTYTRIVLLDFVYSGTCHERTPSGPGKSVRTLQVAARGRDGWAGRDANYNTPCNTTYYYHHQRYAIVVNLKLMQHNNWGIVGIQYANVCIQRRPRWLSVFTSISYVPFVFCRTGSAASALHDVLRSDGIAPLFVGPN